MEEDETEERLDTPTFISQPRSGGRKRIISIILVVVGGLLIIGGGVFFFTRGQGEVNMVSPSPTPSEELPSPSPEPELKREDLKLQVLNGTGKAGEAGKAKAFLEGLGYANVEVGNADSFDYRQTEIRIKASKEAYSGLLEGDLSGEYELARSTKTLSEDSEFDAVVVIGAPAPSPTPTPTPTPTPEATPSASPSPSPSPSPEPTPSPSS